MPTHSTVDRLAVVLLALCCAPIAAPAAAEPPSAIDFARDIAPLFAERCLHCHGPELREGGLRLDQRDAALAGGDGGALVAPGDGAGSRLIQRVTSDDDALRMPQEDDPLAADQIALLRQWIDSGAEWPAAHALAATVASDHWAFRPPTAPALPPVQEAAWPRGAIDRFVLARLEQAGLRPAPEADRYTLVRRLYLDLIGLPPTPEEADAFVRDERADAYERLVEQLLDSPHYGERWARLWLDLARYADTNGYEKDRVRSIWPYRDWVIAALNADLPFDRFTIEQIAGDLLPDATPEQRIATGFHRNTMINEEGGIDVAEFRFAATVDRVATTGTVWLGLTVGCGQCHSHKFDPITQREYYRLFAFLNNADEPEMDAIDPATTARRAEIEGQIAALTAQLDRRFPQLEAEGRFAAWQAEAAAKARHWTVVAPAAAVSRRGATMTVLPDGSVLVSGDKPNLDTYELELRVDLPRVTALRLEALPHERLPDGGPGRAPLFSIGDFLLSEVSVQAGKAEGDLRSAPLAEATHSFAQENRSAALAIDGDLDTGWSIQGRVGEAHQAVFQFQPPLEDAEGTRLAVTLVQHYIHQMTIGRFRLSVTADPQPVVAAGLPADVEEILVAAADERAPEQAVRVRAYYLSVATELAAEQKQIADLRRSLPKHPTSMVMQERLPPHRRTTHIHHRGEFLKPKEVVQPGVPAALHPLPSDASLDRLALARWLVAPENPLVGRVTMNRQWHAFFGRGLVRTLGDFGTQGERPSHPELLDWLAVEFVARGWSIKEMQRLIVTSATYRQSSQASSAAYAVDPGNELLARGPRLRVEAEMVRDIALTASGLLSRKRGGPSVYPPQPEGVTSLAYGGASWPVSAGEDRYRRGLYTFAKRATPYPAFSLFDGPAGDTCLARRERSNTPIQALTLLNDEVFVEAGQALARAVWTSEPASDEARAVAMFRRCVTRPPTADELAAILEFEREQLARFRSGELNAAEVAGCDPAAPQSGMDVDALAAWTATARALLNLDETITKE